MVKRKTKKGAKKKAKRTLKKKRAKPKKKAIAESPAEMTMPEATTPEPITPTESFLPPSGADSSSEQTPPSDSETGSQY